MAEKKGNHMRQFRGRNKSTAVRKTPTKETIRRECGRGNICLAKHFSQVADWYSDAFWSALSHMKNNVIRNHTCTGKKKQGLRF
jgi:hypothetical protein